MKEKKERKKVGEEQRIKGGGKKKMLGSWKTKRFLLHVIGNVIGEAK